MTPRRPAGGMAEKTNVPRGDRAQEDEGTQRRDGVDGRVSSGKRVEEMPETTIESGDAGQH